MDPISLYSGLLDLSNSLATIVNVAHDTKAGQKTLDSTLKELPILFELLKEIMAGVLKAQRAIPQSATLAFQQCQVDLHDVITCLSQRGLMSKGHGGFSHLQAQLSDHSLGSGSSDKSREALKPKNPPKERRSLRERLHLMNVQSLAAAVKSFKDSVLLLRYIAMDFQTHTLLLTQSDQQQEILNEVRAIRPKFQSPATLSRDGSTAEENTSVDEPKYASELNDSPTKTHHQSSLFSDSISFHTPKRRPSEYGRLEVKNFSTRFNVTIGIPRPTSKHNEPPQPDYILARAVLDTGSANSVISHKMITRHNIGHLTRKLDRKTEWTLADGNREIASEATVKLTWYNTHDAMRSYMTEFYIVEVDIYDILLGGDFYREYGPMKGDGSKEQFMMGHFAIPWRSKEQRKREKEAENTAQKDAKAKLQQGHENAKKGSQNSSTNLSPVTENTEASVLGISQGPASKPTAAVNGPNVNSPKQANGNALSPKSNGQNVAANPRIATPQPTAATSVTPIINALTFENNLTSPIVTRPGRHDAETPPKTPEQGPQTAGLAMPNGKVLLGRSVEDVSGVGEENGKLKEVASEGVLLVSGSRAVDI